MFLKSSIIFGLIAGVCATPVPQNPSNDLSKRVPQTDISYVSNPLDSRMASGVKFKDTTCPEYKITYTSKEISDAVKRENAKTSPGTYGNKEGNKALFATTEKLYKASLDNVARAVFSRDAKKNYVYRGLIEHDRGQSNGFHKC